MHCDCTTSLHCPDCGECLDCGECHGCESNDALTAFLVPEPELPMGARRDLHLHGATEAIEHGRGWQAASRGEPFDHAASEWWQEGYRFAKARPYLD
jgi:hypothetical protein